MSRRKSGRLSALIFAILLLKGGSAAATELIQGIQLLGQTGFYSLSSAASTGKETSISGYGTHSAYVELALKDRWKVSAGLSYTLSSGFSGDAATGYDIVAKYYYLSNAVHKQVVYDNVIWLSDDQWKPYAGLALRNREFFAVLSTTYVGFGVLAGLDYPLNREYFINGEIRFDQLSGNEGSSLRQMNVVVGFGLYIH